MPVHGGDVGCSGVDAGGAGLYAYACAVSQGVAGGGWVCVYSRCMVGRERNITHLRQCVCVSAVIWASVMSVFGL